MKKGDKITVFSLPDDSQEVEIKEVGSVYAYFEIKVRYKYRKYRIHIKTKEIQMYIKGWCLCSLKLKTD